MKLNFNLNLKQTQNLVMTQELRQAIQLLQYTSIELNEFLANELEENPMLDMEETSSNKLEEVENIDNETKDSEIDWQEYAEKYDDNSYKQEVDRNTEENNIEAYTSYNPTLREDLMTQLNITEFNKEERLIAELIINNIDDNGYFISTVEEMANSLKIEEEKIEEVLKVIQTFEPIGVGARDLEECLLLQVDEDLEIVRDLIVNNLEDIASNRMVKLAKEYDVDPLVIQDACDYIRTLEPKPGANYKGDTDIKYIIPDATIELIDNEYVITVNDFTGPKLRINNFYKSILKDGGDVNATEFLQNKYNSAAWIIKSIEQRRETIYNVVKSILKFQYGFFKEGEKALVPLTLKEVADDIEMHESTISRATNGKYVQTPRGLYELKYFFNAGLSAKSGDVSSTSVKSLIKDIIDNEDRKKPLSDQKISTLLESKGTKVSRRTVAKYREEMDIPASNLRKRI